MTTIKQAKRMGLKIESEHAKTYKMLAQYVKKHKALPSKKVFFGSISGDHIKELGPQYYPNLIKLEKSMKKKK